MRRLWPEILETLKSKRRVTWILLSQQAQVVGMDGSRLQVAFNNPGARAQFTSSGHDELLRMALQDVFRAEIGVDAVIDPSIGGGASSGGAGGPSSSGPSGPSGKPSTPGGGSPDASPGSSVSSTPPAIPPASSGPGDTVAATGDTQPERQSTSAPPTRQPAGPRPTGQPGRPADDGIDPDDPTIDEHGMSHQDLLARTLGASVIKEIDHGQ